MTIRAEVVAHSVSPCGVEIATLQLLYPLEIHREFMTHRDFSRNASSTRAIPWPRYRDWVLSDPYVPIYWGSNQKGMQSGDPISEVDESICRGVWLSALQAAAATGDQLFSMGPHKQIVNQLLSPWAHINVVVTATRWENFFRQRLDKAAKPEMQALAKAMAIAIQDSVPILRGTDTRNPRSQKDWHLPYVTLEERRSYPVTVLKQISAARCARVSYVTREGKAPDVTSDLALFDRLVGGNVMHASPLEHQAVTHWAVSADVRSGNLHGWIQHRKEYEEFMKLPSFILADRLAEYGDRDYIVNDEGGES